MEEQTPPTEAEKPTTLHLVGAEDPEPATPHEEKAAQAEALAESYANGDISQEQFEEAVKMLYPTATVIAQRDEPPTDEELEAQGEELVKQYKRLSAQNRIKEQDLMQTFGIVLRTEDMVRTRFEMLLNRFLPEGTLGRLEYEVEWQTILSTNLETAKNQIMQQQRQSRLAVPQGTHAGGKPTLVLPGQ